MTASGRFVREFEEAFARYVGAEYAIACCNGTATLHLALMALDARGPIWTTPLTMSATTLAIIHAGGRPMYIDVDPDTWMPPRLGPKLGIGVSLYGAPAGRCVVDDAAQRLGPHNPECAFTSYSFQASKHITTGEGGMLVTNDGDLAELARSLGSLGYDLPNDRPRIDTRAIRDPNAVRHVRLGYNFRMADLVALEGLHQLEHADDILSRRRQAALCYAQAMDGCDWLTRQHGNEAFWTFAVAISEGDWKPDVDRGDCTGEASDYFDPGPSFGVVADAIERHGGERPYAAWRLSYDEPALAFLKTHACPVAQSLQPRIMQFQTNSIEAAERNAGALRAAIREVGG